jgi:hypothetical protein
LLRQYADQGKVKRRMALVPASFLPLAQDL